MFRKHKERASFLMVYIREAHPSDSNWADKAKEIADPTTLAERGAVAAQCCSELALSLPTVVDDMQDTANQRYRAWPERLYVIGRDGKIAYKGGLGPFGFAPEEAERALLQVLEGEGKSGEGERERGRERDGGR
jgi:hypothetical protein